MSQKHITALVKAQYKALNAKDNKERLTYMIAGIKDGKFYTHAHVADFGIFDVNAPDTVFIPEKDLELSRITGAKIATITMNMEKFFDAYYGGETTEPQPDIAPETKPETPIPDPEALKELDEDGVEKLAKACKKAIKAEDFKKARKILSKLDGQDCYKKLAKKLAKADS